MTRDRFDLPIRIVVEQPLTGVEIALQRGKATKAELVPPTRRTAEAAEFDLGVTVEGRLPDGRPRLLGPLVQGPPDARFVYLTVGTYAGQKDSPWGGRMKVPLGDIQWKDIESLASNCRLTARVPGRAAKGGPMLATVPILPPGWTWR